MGMMLECDLCENQCSELTTVKFKIITDKESTYKPVKLCNNCLKKLEAIAKDNGVSNE